MLFFDGTGFSDGTNLAASSAIFRLLNHMLILDTMVKHKERKKDGIVLAKD